MCGGPETRGQCRSIGEIAADMVRRIQPGRKVHLAGPSYFRKVEEIVNPKVNVPLAGGFNDRGNVLRWDVLPADPGHHRRRRKV